MSTTPLAMRTHDRDMRWSLMALSMGLQIDSWLRPGSAVQRASDLFSTPQPGTRVRAEADPADDAEHEFVEVRGERVAIYRYGDPDKQPLVVLSHGWSSYGMRYRPWLETLREAGYAVVCFDHIGHGRSSGEQATLATFARSTAAVVDHFGGAYALVGHSLGGAGVALAMADGARAERAILIAPAADARDATRRFARVLRLPTPLLRSLREELERRERRPFEEFSAHRIGPRLVQPGLILHDLEDAIVPWDEGERWARYWPDAHLLSSSGLGHRDILTAPATVAASLAFLQGECVGQRVLSTLNLPYGLA